MVGNVFYSTCTVQMYVLEMVTLFYCCHGFGLFVSRTAGKIVEACPVSSVLLISFINPFGILKKIT